MEDELDKILHKAGLLGGFYRISASNQSTVNVLSSTDTYDETKQAIEELLIKAYRNGYNDNARDCYCWQTIPDGLIPHKHLLDDGESYDIRPNINKLLEKEDL